MNEILRNLPIDAERHRFLSAIIGESVQANHRLINHIRANGITKRYCMGKPFAEDGKILVAQAERDIELANVLLNELG